jgi:peptidoglycan/xylan/chitin deacetylase (PgdA/CDA1 family)
MNSNERRDPGARPEDGGILERPISRRGILAAIGGMVIAAPVVAAAANIAKASPAQASTIPIPIPAPARLVGWPAHYIAGGPHDIALTIDDGPSGYYTPLVLKILAQYKVHATFCMVGNRVVANASNKAAAREVHAQGHVIAAHTWSHPHLPQLSASAAREEISSGIKAIEDVTGTRPTIFRAPFGEWTNSVLNYCEAEWLSALQWSVDPRDWFDPGVSSIVRTVLSQTRTGSIILEHDGGGRRIETIEALKIFIPALLDRGYRFRTL